jgi:uncharacterized protein YuzE
MNPLKADYDSRADVLYLHKHRPVASTTETHDDGLLLRYSCDDGSPSGVTVVSYRRDWLAHRVSLSTRVAEFLGIDSTLVERVLSGLDVQAHAK